MSGGEEKEQAVEEIKTFYKALVASRDLEMEALKTFANACVKVHGCLSDELISKITVAIDKKGYSRARIQQLRHGKITKG